MKNDGNGRGKGRGDRGWNGAFLGFFGALFAYSKVL